MKRKIFIIGVLALTLSCTRKVEHCQDDGSAAARTDCVGDHAAPRPRPVKG